MKSENYTTNKSLFWGIILLGLMACNDESNTKESKTTSNILESSSQKPQLDFFDLPDSIVKTKVGLAGKTCIPIAKNANNQNCSVAMTKSPLHGTLTPSVLGNSLCFEYMPKADYVGSDQFDCKVCFTASGFCQEKTWFVEVKNGAKSGIAVTPTSAKSPQTTTKKNEQKEIPPPTFPVQSTIFDADKKNNDGYVPKN